MKVSEVKVGPKVQIEKKNSDTFRVLYNETQKEIYISQFGNLEVVYDAKYNVYRVPAFSEGIAEYNKMVNNHCNQYGCE